MGSIKRVFHSIGHSSVTKYLVTIIFFALIIVVVDENSVMNRMERIKEIEALQEEIDMLKSQYEEDTRKLNDLDEYEHVVRMAREKYYMKRPNEDVFIFKVEE